MKNKVFEQVEIYRDELVALADQIFDNPEVGLKEFKASAWLENYLEAHGFTVERGIGGLETAFRAVYENGCGGPSFGILCEYDALEKQGHACGHHLQGPCALGAAMAIKDILKEKPYRLVVYGTPAEESICGKVTMIENGCFKDIDVALMMHVDGATRVDVKYLANVKYKVVFHGIQAHAARKPEEGKSALDALILSFQGIELSLIHI